MSSAMILSDVNLLATLGFSPKRLERLHRCIEKFVDEEKHAGITLLVLRKGQVADVFAAGFQDRILGIPMQRDTVVRIYSMTKIVVSVAALILLEEGRLGLLDPVKDYLPEFGDPQVVIGGTSENPQLAPASEPITIHHLLTHTSGIIYEAPGEPIGEIYQRGGLEDAESLAEMVSSWRGCP